LRLVALTNLLMHFDLFSEARERTRANSIEKGTGIRGTLIWIDDGSWNGKSMARLHITDCDQPDSLETLKEVCTKSGSNLDTNRLSWTRLFRKITVRTSSLWMRNLLRRPSGASIDLPKDCLMRGRQSS
jgi:hypothetical protein